MRATDELRRLLDERGVAHSDHYLSTTWRDGHGILHLAGEPMADGVLVVDMLTPEQAVAATLGGGTCEFVSSKGSEYPPVCSACGYELGIYDCEWFEGGTYGYSGNYCPNCGAKVTPKYSEILRSEVDE